MKKTFILICILFSIAIGGCNNKINDITPLREYALNFNPNTDGYHDYNDIPYDVTKVLENYPIDSEYKKYVMLVFLKICSYEFGKFHQTYELRNENLFKRNSPFVNAYYKITNTKGYDFFSATYGFNLSEKNPEFLKDKNIKLEIHKIDSVTALFGIK